MGHTMHAVGAPPHTEAIDSDDDLVEPVTQAAAEQDDGHSEHWEFRRAVGPGRSSCGHFRPTRHASLDAGHLQQRVYAAAHVLDRHAGGAQAAAGAFSGSGKGANRGSDTSPNEGIEIAWVWPPCVASDTGPVEFAVNVAPREWLSGKHSHRRVPCWPVTGLTLHITYGEQLLSVVELDICGTTKVRLQLPPALTSPNLNFITVMLVDHGKVGPATQLLTMPSSAADEFSGLFRILVEHEMLPQHTAAHPEFVTMLFGSSGCSSGSTVRSYSTLFNSINSGSHSMPKAATAGAKGRISPPPRASQGASAPGAAGLPGISNSFLQQQLLLQQGHGQPLRHQRGKQKPRRDSAGYVQVAGSPAVVRQWSSAGPAAGPPGRAYAAAAARARSPPPCASRGSGSWDTAAVVAAARARRPRRASDGELAAMSLVEAEVLSSNHDDSSQTLTTIDGSLGTANESQVLRMLASGPSGLTDTLAGAAADGDSTQLPQRQEQLQLQQLQEQGVLCMGQESACNSEDLPRLAIWASSGAADAPDQPAAALMMLGESCDVDGVHSDQAVAASSSAHGKADVHTQLHQQQRHHQQLGQGLLEPESRKSLSLDRCAVHVHNEVERALRTRTRMSLDEGARTRLSIDEVARAGSGGALQMAQAADATLGAPVAAAAASTAAAVTACSSLFASTDPAMAAAAAAAAASMRQQVPGRAGLVTPAPPFGTSSATPAAAAAGSSSSAQAGAAVAVPVGAATSSGAGQQGSANAVGLGLAAGAAAGPAGRMSFGSSRGLERRTAAEASMAAAFTTAWTCHMLELASDLQYLVVCVPNAFASNLETWFGRIIGSRGGSSSSGGGGGFWPVGGAGLAGGAGGSGGMGGDRRSESSWDSSMYMRRLGQVLDTLQEHKMWTTMSLLLQHCSCGGLDLYPAGCLHQHLQQQHAQQHQQQLAQQQQQQPQERQQLEAVSQLTGPLDPTSLTPDYLEYLQSLGVGSASNWVRPVPAMTNTQLPRIRPGRSLPPASASAGSNQAGGVAGAGAGSSSSSGSGASTSVLRAAYMQAAGPSRRGAASIDLTPADLAEARRASAAAVADSRSGGSRFSASSGSNSGSRRQRRPQGQPRQHRGPRRSLSWPIGVLYSAFSWAQTAQLRHRQRSLWQRAWGLHPLAEGSERDSESSAASSMDASSFRSSSSTQRSSTVTSLDDGAPWASRVSSGLGRWTGGPAAAVAAAAAAAAGRGSRGSNSLQQDTAARRSGSISEKAAAGAGAARGSWSAGVASRQDAAARCSTAAAAAAAVTAEAAAPKSFDAAAARQAADAAAGRDSTAAVQRIAALQNSLFAQASLPPDKVESLKAAVEARAAQRCQQQQPEAIPAAPAAAAITAAEEPQATSSLVAADASAGNSGFTVQEAAAQNPGSALSAPEQDVAGAAESGTAVTALQEPQEQQTGCGDQLDAAGTTTAPQPNHVIPGEAAAAADVALDAESAANPSADAAASSAAAQQASSAPLLKMPSSQTLEAEDSIRLMPPTRQQRKAAKAAAAADAAEQRASVVAAALTVVGVVEQCTSQLLTALMVLYCLCFLPSIIPGLQPPHLVDAMSRRPAWMEGMLLLLLGLHWFAVTNVSIIRPTSQRPRTSMEAHRAAIAAVEAAALAAVVDGGQDEGPGGLEARRLRRRQEHRLQRLRERQQRLLGRAMVSSVAAAAALGLLCYSLFVFVAAWADHALGEGAAAVWLYSWWGEWQGRVSGQQ